MVSVNRDGRDGAGSGAGDNLHHDDNNAFGDSGRFGAVSEPPRQLHWPTVLVAGAVAAVVSSLILTLGVIGLHRSADRPAEIVVAVDPRGAVTVDGTPVADGVTVAPGSVIEYDLVVTNTGTVTLTGITVDPVARGHGLGRAVTIELTRRAIAEHGWCTLGMYSINDTARTLYLSLGYEIGARWSSGELR